MNIALNRKRLTNPVQQLVSAGGEEDASKERALGNARR